MASILVTESILRKVRMISISRTAQRATIRFLDPALHRERDTEFRGDAWEEKGIIESVSITQGVLDEVSRVIRPSIDANFREQIAAIEPHKTIKGHRRRKLEKAT